MKDNKNTQKSIPISEEKRKKLIQEASAYFLTKNAESYKALSKK